MTDQTQLTEQGNGQTPTTQRAQQRRRNTITPPVDIFENEFGVALIADLPGVERSALDVRVHDGNLYIEAEARLPAPAGLTLHHAELQEPYYYRAFALSADFDTSKIEASLQNGVLKLAIPRREEAKPRRIEIAG
jgi:HSP20 family molecular chaperone IbpA